MEKIGKSKLQFFLGVFLSFVHIVFMEDRCRTLQFDEQYYEDSAFTKNIVETVSVENEDQCKVACFIETACRSYNIGPPLDSDAGKRICELSSSDHTSYPSDLVSRPGFIYRPSQNLCSDRCPESQTCFPDPGTGEHSCLCTDPGFTGQNCDEDIDECSTGAHDCAAEANCTNSAGSFVCSCSNGYEGDGKACQEKDECASGEHNCHVSATCTNTIGSFTCSCLEGQLQDGDECFGFPFHWILNGTDRLMTLHGAARFEEQDGRTVLFLDGTTGTYAQTPAIPFQQSNLTIAMWVKLTSLDNRYIYSDWSNAGHQFGFRVSADETVCFEARRQTGIPPTVFGSCTTTTFTRVPLNTWRHVAVTWNRVQLTAKLFINGIKGANETIDPHPSLDFKKNSNLFYDIGLKRDSQALVTGYFSDLIIFDRDLEENEIREELFVNHPLSSFV